MADTYLPFPETAPLQRPFFMFDEQGHELLVLAAVYEVRPIDWSAPGAAIRCQTRYLAEAMSQRITDAGRPSKVVPVPINAIDVTVAAYANFGEHPDPDRRRMYQASWCCQDDQTAPLPRRQVNR